jgi:hypothetical protein
MRSGRGCKRRHGQRRYPNSRLGRKLSVAGRGFTDIFGEDEALLNFSITRK